MSNSSAGEAQRVIVKKMAENEAGRKMFDAACARLAAGVAELKDGREDLKQERVKFQERVEAFSEAARALAERT